MFYQLIATYRHPGTSGQSACAKATRQCYLSEIDALDAASELLQEEDERRRSKASKLPALTDLQMEGPDGVLTDYGELRRAAMSQD